MSLSPGVNALASDYDSGQSTPEEAVSELLATIDRLDSTIEAWQALYADEATAAAVAATKARAAGQRIGPFHGVPFALKDIVDVEGRVTTAGSKAWVDRLSPSTAL
ncbi:MAG: aspartyl-tRNA(Asn)/glutamyl-tRNA(Gln) amidotransferase subunit A, partial [Acidimicrobiales bacterium]